MSALVGSRLGPYEITAKLGEGGMGEVYRATDTKLDRQVAIKVLPAVFTADGQQFVLNRSVANDTIPIVVVLDWTALLEKKTP